MSGSYFYKEHPKTCAPDDFWGQVRRTVAGKPVSQEQIDMIVAAVNDALALTPEDFLLDLCCGNGALTTYFFEQCRGGVGVDVSDYLIDVARKNFVKRGQQEFVIGDVLAFVRACDAPERFTRGLCYGSINYLARENVRELLGVVRRRFRNVRALFVGNIADTEKARVFFGENYRAGIEDDPGSPIGLWWTPAQFTEAAAAAGWDAEIRRMPQGYYAAHYRFDALLKPAAGSR